MNDFLVCFEFSHFKTLVNNSISIDTSVRKPHDI